MAISIEQFGIDQLSVGERLELIEQIWNTLPEQVSPESLPDWHLAEIISRRKTLDTNPVEGKPWRDALRAVEEAK